MPRRLPKFRHFPDGTIIAPMRGGVPPAPPEGYQHSPWDQWTYIPILKECEHRTEKKPKGCCARMKQLHCTYAEKNVNRKICFKCDANPEEYHGPKD